MSTEEMRNRLIERIQSTNDKSMLEKLFGLLELNHEEKRISLSTELKKKITMGIKDIEEGRFQTSRQADKEAQEWLKE